MDGAQAGALTCSNSSVMVLGSSCLWNHIMYLVWNRHDCFFRALAARYCAFVPWGRKGDPGIRGGVSKLEGARGTGQGNRADPRPRHRPRLGWTIRVEMGWGTRHTNAGQEKENETGGGNCFQRSFEKKEKLIVMS